MLRDAIDRRVTWPHAATSVHVAPVGAPGRDDRYRGRGPQFVPAAIEPATQEPSSLRTRQRRRRRNDADGMIEVEIDGMTVRVGRGAEAKTVAAVLSALKAGRNWTDGAARTVSN